MSHDILRFGEESEPGRRRSPVVPLTRCFANTSLADEQAMVGTDPAVWADESFQITLQPGGQCCVRAGASCTYSSGQVTLGEMDEEQIVVADQTYSEKFVLIAEDRVK